GATVLGPLDRGELVQQSNVTADDGGSPRVSFSIESSRALNGAVRKGDRIDLLATYGGSGGDAYTMVVANHVQVAAVSSTSGGLGGGHTIVLTPSLPTH